MPHYEEGGKDRGGQAGDEGSPSPVLPPRLRSLGGKEPVPSVRSARRRVRWGRVFGASVVLVCGMAILAAAAVLVLASPGNGLEPQFPLTPLWHGVSGLRLSLLGQGGEDYGAMPGAKMATGWRSQLERFNFREFNFGEFNFGKFNFGKFKFGEVNFEEVNFEGSNFGELNLGERDNADDDEGADEGTGPLQ